MTRCIQRIVDEDCTLSLRAIITELRRRLSEKQQVYERVIGKHLDGMLHSLKLSRILPANCNSPDVVERTPRICKLVLRRGEFSSSCLHRRIWFQYLEGQKSRTGSRWTACMLIAKCVNKRYATLQFAWRCLKFSVWCITPFRWVG